LQKRDLTVTEKEAKVKTITNDLQIDGESPTLTEDLADMVLDILEIASCSGINLHGTVLQRISERNRNK